MNKITRLLTYLLRGEITQAIKHIEKNKNCAPDCCNKPMEYIGEHQGLYLRTQFYQCRICKRLEILHNR